MAIGTAWFLASTVGGTASADPQTSPSVAERVASVPAAQEQAYAVLDRPQRDGDAIATDQPGPFGTNLRLAREVSTADGAVRVVPGNGTVCLRAQDEVGHGYACGPTAVVQDGVLMISLHDQATGAVTVYGLVPDDAGAVELTTPEGEQELTVTENVFSAELDSADGASVQTEGTTGTYAVP